MTAASSDPAQSHSCIVRHAPPDPAGNVPHSPQPNQPTITPHPPARLSIETLNLNMHDTPRTSCGASSHFHPPYSRCPTPAGPNPVSIIISFGFLLAFDFLWSVAIPVLSPHNVSVPALSAAIPVRYFAYEPAAAAVKLVEYFRETVDSTVSTDVASVPIMIR